MLSLAAIKSGCHIIVDGDPYLVTWNQFSKSGRQGGVMKTKLKNLRHGTTLEKTFQGSDQVEAANLQFRKASFLYQQDDTLEFMDQEDFNQVSLNTTQVGEITNFLRPEQDVDIQYFQGKAINIQLPTKIALQVQETEPGVKGNTAGSVTKNATLETGAIVRVPPFIENGDQVIINTLTGEYIERSKK